MLYNHHWSWIITIHEYSLEGLMMKLKLQSFGDLIRIADSLEKIEDAGKDWRQKGTTEDEMVGWHHQLDGHEFAQASGIDGQGSLVCCSPWGRKESDMTEELNWTDNHHDFRYVLQIQKKHWSNIWLNVSCGFLQIGFYIFVTSLWVPFCICWWQ